MGYGLPGKTRAMVCAEPLARCEILFFQPLLANATLSALDAILADARIGAVVC